MTTRNICILYLLSVPKCRTSNFCSCKGFMEILEVFCTFFRPIWCGTSSPSTFGGCAKTPPWLPAQPPSQVIYGPISTGVLFQHHLVPLSRKICSKFEFFFGYLLFFCTPYVMEMISNQISRIFIPIFKNIAVSYQWVFTAIERALQYDKFRNKYGHLFSKHIKTIFH